MGFRPNYGQQRADRNRAKEQKKQERLKRREEKSAQRKSEHEPPADAADESSKEGTDGS